MLLKLVQRSGFEFGKVLRNWHLSKLDKVYLYLVVLLLFLVIVKKNRKRRAGGAALGAGAVSCDQPDSPDR